MSESDERRWEYKVKTTRETMLGQAECNRLGDEGWELVAVSSSVSDRFESVHRYYFKRLASSVVSERPEGEKNG